MYNIVLKHDQLVEKIPYFISFVEVPVKSFYGIEKMFGYFSIFIV